MRYRKGLEESLMLLAGNSIVEFENLKKTNANNFLVRYKAYIDDLMRKQNG